METSAKAGHNVKSLFRQIADNLPNPEKDAANKTGVHDSELFYLTKCLLVADYIFRGGCQETSRERGTGGVTVSVLNLNRGWANVSAYCDYVRSRNFLCFAHRIHFLLPISTALSSIHCIA
jgi:hypothetical protein